MRGLFWILLLVLLLLFSLLGERSLKREATTRVVIEKGKNPGRLFVVVGGFTTGKQYMEGVIKALHDHGDVARVEYPSSLWSNADPLKIAQGLDQALRGISTEYPDVTLVAYSAGALIARRALLDGYEHDSAWARNTSRAVLIAGMNRGWGFEGEKPADASSTVRLAWRVALWLGRLAGVGRLPDDLQVGAPFVANLRIDWMRTIRLLEKDGKRVPEVVQLLGDIDDVVSAADNEDVRVMASEKYAFLRVRGTGHQNIVDFSDSEHSEHSEHSEPSPPPGPQAAAAKMPEIMGEYRKAKLLIAATLPFADVLKHDEAQPFKQNDKVKSLVFVLHGIRDLGEWSSRFEAAIRGHDDSETMIVSPRYGYLGMGPFLLPGVRKKYVRWFMDEYTEALARYPEVCPGNIHFFGHSNGTWVAAHALKDYSSLRINRVVFAGSVVERDFPWDTLSSQVQQVRNYVGTADWVVSLFPRLFEYWPMSLLRNELGSAGYSGFDIAGAPGCPTPTAGGGGVPSGTTPAVSNVCFVKGQHSAFSNRVDEIVEFLMTGGGKPASEERSRAESMSLSWLSTCLTWLLLAGIVLYVGVRVVSASPAPAWMAFVLYAFIVVRVLQTV